MVALLLNLDVTAQVAINATGAAPNSSAMLDVSSTTMGVLIPRMTQAERDLINAPDGLLIFQTDNTEGFYYWDSAVGNWLLITSGIGGSIVPITLGGTGASDAPTARTNLGLGNLATKSSVNNSDWSGSALTVSNGGTGLTAVTSGRIPFGNTGAALNTDARLAWTTGTATLTISGKIKQTQLTGSLTPGAPTTGEINTATGTTASVAGAGYKVVIKATNGTGLLYLVESDGTNWFYTVMQKAL